jgi:hypothetical protein
MAFWGGSELKTDFEKDRFAHNCLPFILSALDNHPGILDINLSIRVLSIDDKLIA